MTEKMTITGSGVTFQDETDLTDATRVVIAAAFEWEVARADITGESILAEGMKAAARAIRRVEAAATNAGWTPRAVACLGVVAGDVYGRILADVAKQTQKPMAGRS